MTKQEMLEISICDKVNLKRQMENSGANSQNSERAEIIEYTISNLQRDIAGEKVCMPGCVNYKPQVPYGYDGVGVSGPQFGGYNGVSGPLSGVINR